MTGNLDWVLLVLCGMIGGGCIGYWIGLIVAEIRNSSLTEASK